MIPDYEALVRSGYDYLPVGGALLRPRPGIDLADNHRTTEVVPDGQKEPV
jgi:hypothetical protein